MRTTLKPQEFLRPPSDESPEEDIPKLVVYRNTDRAATSMSNARKLTRQPTKPSISPFKKQETLKQTDPAIQHIILPPKPEPVEFDSIKIVEDYLKKEKTNQFDPEIENVSEAMIEKQISNYEEEKTVIAYRLQMLKTEVLHLQRNDLKAVYINQNMQLLADKQALIDKVVRLFRDKQTMRTQIQNQKVLVSQITSKIIMMETTFTEQLHQLKTYNATLPTEKENQLEMQNLKLQSALDKELILREKLEKSVQTNIQTFENLFKEAEEAKKHIIDQLKDLKRKKEDLERQTKLSEELQQQQRFGKGGDQGQGKALGQLPAVAHDMRHSVAGTQQMHSISSTSSKQLSTSSHLSKFILKNAQPSQESASQKAQLNNVLSGLNNEKQQQQFNPPQQLAVPTGETQKRANSLATIKENDVSSPKSFADDSSLNNINNSQQSIGNKKATTSTTSRKI